VIRRACNLNPKGLHFLLPELFAIWDSRIARLFEFKNGSHNNAPSYFSYFDLLHRWLKSGNALPRNLSEKMQIEAPKNDPLSELRLVEYALFLASVSKFGGVRRRRVLSNDARLGAEIR
jgi:hypothetical protein